MKRVLALVLAAVLVCSMTACLDHGEPDPLHPPGGNGSSKPTSEEPPVLTISDDSGNPQEALQGTYSWMYDRGDGYWMGVTATWWARFPAVCPLLHSVSCPSKPASCLSEESLLGNPNLTLILVSHHLTPERKAQFTKVFELQPVLSSISATGEVTA